MKAVINGIQAVDTVDVDFVTSGASHSPLSETTPVNCISNCKKRKKIYVRLLLSIDRRETTASAMETVLSEDYICIFLSVKSFNLNATCEGINQFYRSSLQGN